MLLKDQLKIHRYDTRKQMGAVAAAMVADKIKELLSVQEHLNIIFAAAPSQQEFLETLAADASIPWDRINAFHMDEYAGLHADAPQGFGNFLKARIFGKVPFRAVHYINGNAADLDEECTRYAALLNKEGVDIVNMGIGENTHIAFNDPHVADFEDPATVKVVDLDLACRQQQVNDGCFAALDEVPTHALTLTVPALYRARFVYCMVPGPTKAEAVWQTLNAPIAAEHPSTILRRHPRAQLFIDADSGAKLEK
ncbi:6-phosphogluconolactonase [Chitinophaga barathri]|uniref:Glucosamine-6-phosphate deaminase n=1 Tax=Chitinophaga barathri TaxID=1647451 RepID=A0A3N4MFM9_9BACT|nr:6-phosphogluconolactonase [Chitinophaga barathri]RPD42764.1 glucosamine-6-phosphate deaminase [Chitinophaga barathri]